MRILFTFAGGSGHMEPLVPLARAAQAAGHDVAFVGRPWMQPKAEALGFVAFSAGGDAGLAPVRRPLAAYDMGQELRTVGVGFGGRIARERAPGVMDVCAAWRPDLLVCEEIDFGAMVAAEALGLPAATVLVIAAGGFVRPEHVAAPLDAVRAAHGLPPDPELAMLRRGLVLSPFPPSYRRAGDALSGGALPFRIAAPQAGALPPWWPGLDDRPLIYFTLGTVFNVESGDLFQRVLAGLRQLPARLLVTVGRDIDPAELGPQPAHVRVERFVPQAQVLPHCAMVVSHAGSGSVVGALAHGLPMLLLPMGADQPLNAERCAELGLAQALDVLAATPQQVAQAAAALLAEPAYRSAAQALRDEIAALPAPEQIIPALERLAR